MAEGATIGSLVVRIGADADDLLKELKRADSGFGSFGRNVKIAHDAVAVFAAGAAAAGAAVAGLVLVSSRAADAMHKAAQAAGMATSTFSEMAYAAQLSGVGTEALSTAMSRLNRNVSEAAQGSGEAQGAFRALGIEVRNADGSLKSADQILEEVADRFAGFADGPEKSALAIAIFGKAGAAMIPMLNAGKAGLIEMREEARALGVSIDTETGRAAERFNDNLERLQKAGQGLANTLMRELLPALNSVTEAMVSMSKEGGGLKNDIEGVARFIESAALTVFETFAVVGSDVAFVFKMMGGEIGVIGAQLAALARLDFKGFALIGREWRRDSAQARADLDAFQKRVMGLRDSIAAARAQGGAMDMGGSGDIFGGKPRAPGMKDEKKEQDAAKEVEKREQEVRDAIQKAGAERDKLELAQIQRRNEQNAAAEQAALDAYFKRIEDRAAREAEMGQADLERLKMLKTFQFKTEEELELEAHAVRMAQLAQFNDEELAALGGRQAIEERMTQEHQQRLLAIERNKHQQSRMMEIGTFQLASELLQQFAGKSRAAAIAVIAINKGLAAAQVIQATAVATMRAYSDLGPVAGSAAASYIQTLGKVQLGLIAATGLIQAASTGGGAGAGGGIAAPSTFGGAPVPVQPAAPERSAGPTMIVSMQGGEIHSTESVRALLERIAEVTRDGGRVVLA